MDVLSCVCVRVVIGVCRRVRLFIVLLGCVIWWMRLAWRLRLLGKVFVTGRKNVVARLEGYEPQKAMGRFAPGQVAEWLGADSVFRGKCLPVKCDLVWLRQRAEAHTH